MLVSVFPKLVPVSNYRKYGLWSLFSVDLTDIFIIEMTFMC